MVFSDGDNMMLKPLMNPDLKTFRKMALKSRKYARRVGLKKSDLEESIRKVRSANSR